MPCFPALVQTRTVEPPKIKDVIGSGGKMINKIIDETGVKIDITDEGKVMICSQDTFMNERAKEMILDIAIELELNKTYEGRVVRIMQFGAFIECLKDKEGMIHISKLSKERVEKVEDVVKIGDKVRVKTIKIDEKGRVDMMLLEKLS